jgi:hypothetical protein
MSQQIKTADQGTLIIPGAYPSINVQSVPVGISVDGNMVLIGEADGGPDFRAQDLVDVSFTPDQADKVKAMFISGPIVDAFRALASPSADADIVGSANRIYIAKTNASAKAQAVIDTNYGILSDANFGKPGNNYRYQITSIAAETAPTLTSTVIAAFGAPLNALSFTVRLNGAVGVVITLSGNAADHNSAASLSAEMNAQLPTGISVAPGVASGTIVLTVAVDSAAYRKSWGKSFELIDSIAGDLAALGLHLGLVVSSQEPSVEVQISNSNTGLNQTIDIAADVAFTLGYLGTSGTVTINQTAKTLVTTVVGGSGANLSIDLTQYKTLSDLASAINSNIGYSASVSVASQQLPPSAIDAQTTLPIAAGEASVQPGRIKKALSNFVKAMGASALVFAPTAMAGLPNPMANAAFLAGGLRGSTKAVDVSDAVDACGGLVVNMIVPLFSRDASVDIAAGVTDSASTYTIDAVHALIKNHCLHFSTPKLKRHRIGFLSIMDTYAVSRVKAQTAGNYRLSMSFQQASQLNSVGNTVVFQPWIVACIAAGMQCAGFYKSICNKAANVISYMDPSDYDSGSPGDVEDALEAGLLPLAQDTTRNYFVSDQNTYGFDNNNVYNSIQAVYLSDVIALDLTSSLQKEYVGKSTGDINEAIVGAFIAKKMANYKTQRAIVGTQKTPLGYKNLKISLVAPALYVSIEMIIASAIYFIPLSINIDTVGNE